MEGGTKGIAVVVLILAIVVAGYFIYRSRTSSTEMPDQLRQELARQPVEVLDTETGEVITLTRGELGKQEKGMYLNPKTNKRALAAQWGVCTECDKKVAMPYLDLPADTPGMVMDDKLAEVWKCPDCGAAVKVPTGDAPAGEAAGE